MPRARIVRLPYMSICPRPKTRLKRRPLSWHTRLQSPRRISRRAIVGLHGGHHLSRVSREEDDEKSCRSASRPACVSRATISLDSGLVRCRFPRYTGVWGTGQAKARSKTGETLTSFCFSCKLGAAVEAGRMFSFDDAEVIRKMSGKASGPSTNTHCRPAQHGLGGVVDAALESSFVHRDG